MKNSVAPAVVQLLCMLVLHVDSSMVARVVAAMLFSTGYLQLLPQVEAYLQRFSSLS
jgi:hypothetical protein